MERQSDSDFIIVLILKDFRGTPETRQQVLPLTEREFVLDFVIQERGLKKICVLGSDRLPSLGKIAIMGSL